MQSSSLVLQVVASRRDSRSLVADTDPDIKYGTIASDVFGVSGIKVLNLISDGVTKADRLASVVTTKIKRKEESRKALTNTLTKEHCWLVKELMTQFRDIQARIQEVDRELAKKIQPYAHLVEELRKIPGIDTVLAVGILAEATTNMKNFADERKFAAWTGTAAGNNESAGKKKIEVPTRQSGTEKNSHPSRPGSGIKTWLLLQGQIPGLRGGREDGASLPDLHQFEAPRTHRRSQEQGAGR